MSSNGEDPLAERLSQRAANNHPLHMESKAAEVRGGLPNTPCAVASVAFALGSLWGVSLLTFLVGGFEKYWWSTYQLAFFFAAWAFFHWAEFAVTAGWNFEKCNIDCAYIIELPTYRQPYFVASFSIPTEQRQDVSCCAYDSGH
jgi:protein-S-isoprenylcysteine O-methyltransferase